MQSQIIQLLKMGDQVAIAQLYDSYGGALYGIILRIVSSEELAQQVLENTFLKAWRSRANYDESKGRLFTWLMNIAYNTAMDTARASHFYKNNNTFEQKTDPSNLKRVSVLNPLLKKINQNFDSLTDGDV